MNQASRPAPGADASALAQEPAPLAIYVHLPFCREHCPYCDFYTISADNPRARLLGDYLPWVRRELALALEADPGLAGRPLRSIYLGGGTPSLYRPEELAPLFEDFRAAWEVGPEVEVTMEANPGSLFLGGLRDYGALGVNRVSLGVQGFGDEALRELGRAHDSADARRSLDALAQANFLRSWTADLIFGYPKQTLDSLRADLGELVERGAPHISVYGLTLHPGTPYESRHAKGDLPLPPEETVLEMFRETRRLAREAGYEAYEFSNFARPGHRSRHNSAYWTLDPVLPLGVSACGYLGGRRVENPRSLDRYAKEIQAGRLARTSEEPLRGRQLAGETLMCALRRAEGVPFGWASGRCGADVRALYAEEFAEGLRAGWLDAGAFEAGTLRLTDAGVEMSDEFFASLF